MRLCALYFIQPKHKKDQHETAQCWHCKSVPWMKIKLRSQFCNCKKRTNICFLLNGKDVKQTSERTGKMKMSERKQTEQRTEAVVRWALNKTKYLRTRLNSIYFILLAMLSDSFKFGLAITQLHTHRLIQLIRDATEKSIQNEVKKISHFTLKYFNCIAWVDFRSRSSNCLLTAKYIYTKFMVVYVCVSSFLFRMYIYSRREFLTSYLIPFLIPKNYNGAEFNAALALH